MRRALLAGAAVVLVVLAAGPASAADEMGLSRDGVTFTPTLDEPLFADELLVPGDEVSETFYVRNQGSALAELTLDLLGPSVPDLLATGDVTVTATALGSTTTIAEAGERRLLTLPDIVDGQVVPVTVDVAFDEDSTNDSQLLSSDVSFRVNLRQTAAVLDENVDDDADGDADGGGDADSGVLDDSASLPDTGAPSTGWAVLAIALVGTGTALLARRRTPTRRTTDGAHHG